MWSVVQNNYDVPRSQVCCNWATGSEEPAVARDVTAGLTVVFFDDTAIGLAPYQRCKGQLENVKDAGMLLYKTLQSNCQHASSPCLQYTHCHSNSTFKWTDKLDTCTINQKCIWKQVKRLKLAQATWEIPIIPSHFLVEPDYAWKKDTVISFAVKQQQHHTGI